ncbi:MAG: AsmA-like C-terminal region-containing protein [Rhizobiaceae bacterium]
MLARIFVLVGSLVVVALCAALIGPYFVDWTSYRADFEREASAILGRKVEVKGEADARILPFPSLSFTNIVVGGAEDPVLTAESFSMDAELAPFLSGEVLIFDMRIVKPSARVMVGEDGVIDWTVRPSTPFDPSRIALEKLTIVDGKLRIIDQAGGREHLLSEVNSTVSARSLRGPWRVGGSLRVDGNRTTITASSGVADGSGATRLRLTARPEAFPVEIESDGNVGLADGVIDYQGTFRVVGITPVKDELRGTDGEPPKVVADAPPNRLSGTFVLGKDRLDFDSFRFETGPIADPYVADGKAYIELGKEPKFNVTANGAQVRLTNWGENVNAGATIGDRLAALQEMLTLFPKPPIPGVVDVNLPAVVAGDTTIRDVALSAAPALDGWYLSSASATLPGRSTLEAKGFLTTGKKPRFEGSLLLAVKQPSGFAAWLSKDVDAAIRQLPAAGFSGDVYLDAARQSFKRMEIILGDAKLTGEIDRTVPANAKPVLAARLEGGALNAETASALASLFVSDTGAFRYIGHDVDLKVKAGPVDFSGLTAAALDTALRVKDERLDIDKLSIADVAGASLSATGSVRGLGSEAVGDIDTTIVAGDLKPLVDLLARTFPANSALREVSERAAGFPALLTDTRLDVTGSAAMAAWPVVDVALSAKGRAGGSDFAATISGNYNNGIAPEAPFEMMYQAGNADATALLAMTGLPTLPLGVVGPGKLEALFKGTLAGGLDTSIAISGDTFRASFDGTAMPGADGLAARGKAEIESKDVEPWLMTVGAAIPGMGLGTPVAIVADADYGKGLLVLNDIEGSLAGTAVSGDLNVAMEAGSPKFSGALSLDRLDLFPLAEMVFGGPALASSADGGWVAAPFQEKPAAPFAADVALTAGTLEAGPLPPVHEASFGLQVDGQRLRIADLDAKFANGKVNGLVELKNESGVGLLGSQLKLSAVDVALLLAAFGMDDPAAKGQADATASLSSSGKSVSGMVSALAGSGTVALRSLEARALNAGALAPLVQQSDKIGRDLDAAKTASFAPAIVGDGVFQAGDSQFAFSVANGIIRMPATAFDRDQAKLTVELRADLAKQELAGEGSFTWKPGDFAQVGSEPSVRLVFNGPMTQPKATLDTAPLAQFLTQRQLEIEQARVEAMQTALLEKQRLRRETAYYVARREARAILATDEARRREAAARLQEQLKREAEARAKAEAEARLKAEAQARAVAEKAKAEAEARAKAEAEARLKAEAQAKANAEKAKAEADAKAKAEAEAKAEAAAAVAAKARAESEARAKAESEAKALAETGNAPTPDAAEPATPPSPAPPSATVPPSGNPETTQQPAAAATSEADSARREAQGQTVLEQQAKPETVPPRPARAPASGKPKAAQFPPPPPPPAQTLGDLLRSIGQ